MKKSQMDILFLMVFCILLSSCFVSASLGISPAVQEFNFMPNEKYGITYTIYSDQPERVIDLYAEGNLTDYVTFDKNELVGGGKFKVVFNLPQSITMPGRLRTYIAAKERLPTNVLIGTSLSMRAVVYLNVPYPGRYIESSMSIPDVNVGERTAVELYVINRGTEKVFVNPTINFYDSHMALVKTMNFEPVLLNTNDEQYFRRYLETADLKPDIYLAEATIDYSGLIKEVNRSFQVGNLFVNITDFTKNVTAGEINNFIIAAKSNWNGNIEGVYGDVKILNNNTPIISFRTPSIDLEAWEEKNITSYFEAPVLKSGEYPIEITLNYLRHTTFNSGTIFFKGKGNYRKMLIISGSILTILILLFVIYFIIVRLKKPKRRRKR